MTKVRITHPEKILFPEDGYTKADVVEYYRRVAPVMLPHMRRHPLAMLRFNEGIHGERFFHKQAPTYFPDFIDRVEVPKSKGTTTYAVCDNIDTLAYIANHNSIEFHVLPVRADDLLHPDRMVFDLDPSIDEFSQVRDAARWIHDLLDEVGLASFVMTSGSRGLHIWVPLDRKAPTEEVMDFAAATASVLVAGHPDILTSEFSKAERGEKIYLDIGRNAPAQHAVAPYSLRAKPGAPVATPIDWVDVDDPDLSPQQWTIKTVVERVAADPWKGMYRRARSLHRPRRRLDEIS